MTLDEKVLSSFYDIITENKQEMFDRIAAERTNHLTVVMENIHQEHNASAVLRTCDCFGIQTLHAIEKNNTYEIQRDIALGAGNWVDLYTHSDGANPTTNCLEELKSKGYKIVATSPHAKLDINELAEQTNNYLNKNRVKEKKGTSIFFGLTPNKNGEPLEGFTPEWDEFVNDSYEYGKEIRDKMNFLYRKLPYEFKIHVDTGEGENNSVVIINVDDYIIK